MRDRACITIAFREIRMKKILLLVILVLVIAIFVVGQQVNPPVILPNGWLGGATVPTTCKSGVSPAFYNWTSFTLWDCLNSVYTLRATGGGISTPADVYVAKTGLDTNNCQIATPCLTIARAVSLIPQNVDKAYQIHIIDATPNLTYAEPWNLIGIQNGKDPSKAITLSSVAPVILSGGAADGTISGIVVIHSQLYAVLNLAFGSQLLQPGGVFQGVDVQNGELVIVNPIIVTNMFDSIYTNNGGLVHLQGSITSQGYTHTTMWSEGFSRILREFPTAATAIIPNDTVTGTALNQPAKIVNGRALVPSAADTNIPVYICQAGCGTTGNATLLMAGNGACINDNNVLAIGTYIVNSTSPGFCHGTGTTTPPTSGWVLGISTNTNNAGLGITIAVTEHVTAQATGAGATQAIAAMTYGVATAGAGNVAPTNIQVSGQNLECIGGALHTTEGTTPATGFVTCNNPALVGGSIAIAGTDFADVSFPVVQLTLTNWGQGFGCNSSAYLEWDGLITYTNVTTHISCTNSQIHN